MKLPLGPVETRAPFPPKDMPTPDSEKLSRKGPSEMLRRQDQPILHLTHRPFGLGASTFASPGEGSGPAPFGSRSASSGVSNAFQNLSLSFNLGQFKKSPYRGCRYACVLRPYQPPRDPSSTMPYRDRPGFSRRLPSLCRLAKRHAAPMTRTGLRSGHCGSASRRSPPSGSLSIVNLDRLRKTRRRGLRGSRGKQRTTCKLAPAELKFQFGIILLRLSTRHSERV